MDTITKLCLMASIMLNLVCLKLILNSNIGNTSWGDEEESSKLSMCSGHGRAHLDGFGCECNACFTGAHCSQILPNCTLDLDSGDPLFLEPFWIKNAKKSEIVVQGWQRMGYEYEDGSLISKALVQEITKLHKFTKNAVTEDKYIIFGVGSTQLLNAAVHALSVRNTNSAAPVNVVAAVPHYSVFKSQTKLFQTKTYEFKGDASLFLKTINTSNLDKPTNVIEFVTSPSNPEGALADGVVSNSKMINVKRIHDLAYYWPHYTPIPSQLDEDLMIFTLSKLTGHGGTRFGWAIIKDKTVYEKMLEYVEENTYGVARETQLRALKLLRVARQDNVDGNIFEFGYETMKIRWQKLYKILSSSNRFSLQELPSRYCSFSKITKPVSPAYAWIKCENKEDKDCYKVLSQEGNIKGITGKKFGADEDHVRLSLCKTNDDFDLLIRRIQLLVTKEKELVPAIRLNLGDSNSSQPKLELCSLDKLLGSGGGEKQ